MIKYDVENVFFSLMCVCNNLNDDANKIEYRKIVGKQSHLIYDVIFAYN